MRDHAKEADEVWRLIKNPKPYTVEQLENAGLGGSRYFANQNYRTMKKGHRFKHGVNGKTYEWTGETWDEIPESDGNPPGNPDQEIDPNGWSKTE